MGEITDLIGIYGGDQAAVISDAERRTAVAQVLPMTATRPATTSTTSSGSSSSRRGPTRESGAPPGTHPFLSVDAALRDLSKDPLLVGRMRARR